jgi:hypothetical protein
MDIILIDIPSEHVYIMYALQRKIKPQDQNSKEIFALVNTRPTGDDYRQGVRQLHPQNVRMKKLRARNSPELFLYKINSEDRHYTCVAACAPRLGDEVVLTNLLVYTSHRSLCEQGG